MNNELATKTVKELRDLAKERNIVGRWGMTKEELVNALSDVQKSKTAQDYLNDISPGTLVAFTRGKNKDFAMSGKFVSHDISAGKVVVETKRGTLFSLSPSDFIWVKRGGRGPRWVYLMFNSKNRTGGDDDGPKDREADAQLDS